MYGYNCTSAPKNQSYNRNIKKLILKVKDKET